VSELDDEHILNRQSRLIVKQGEQLRINQKWIENFKLILVTIGGFFFCLGLTMGFLVS